MKYMGSKARLAKEILPHILKDRTPEQWYVEPFVGGGNLIDKVTGLRLGGDINKYVVALLKHIVNGGDLPYLDKETYKAIHKNKSNFDEWLVGYAGICCSYSGKWFGGYAGKVTTKEGIRDYQAEAQNNLKKQAPNLKGVVFESCSYQELTIPPNSVIYCDPQYKDTTNYNLTDLPKFDHNAFWDLVQI